MISILVNIQSIYIQFVCEFALENAWIAVLELQKWNNFLGEDPQTPVFARNVASMTVQVNHKKLYYNYYTLGKYLLKIQISGKILLCYVPVDWGVQWSKN
jgi:hypothetical protein